MVVLLLGFVPACGGGGGGDMGPPCRSIRDVADALGRLRASEGDTSASASTFDAAATAFEQTPAPVGLEEDWRVAAEALRYYGESARGFASGRGEETARRSEADVRMWRAALARITAFGIDRCGTGWRTAFGDCRRGPVPAGADDTRLLFPCES